MDSRLRGNDGCWRRLWVGLVKFALKFAEVSKAVERSSEKLGLCFRRPFGICGVRGRSPRYGLCGFG